MQIFEKCQKVGSRKSVVFVVSVIVTSALDKVSNGEL